MKYAYFSHKLTRYEAMQKVFGLLLTSTPDLEMIKSYMENDNDFKLQEFCCSNLRHDIEWSTGIGIIDAAQVIYNEAVGNANIEGDDHDN